MRLPRAAVPVAAFVVLGVVIAVLPSFVSAFRHSSSPTSASTSSP